MASLRKQWQIELGASLVEYALLLALISVTAIVFVRSFGNSVSVKFSEVSSAAG